MYYPNHKISNYFNLKNLLILIVLGIGVYFLLKPEKHNYKKDDKIINKNIDSLQNKLDSLNKVSVLLENKDSLYRESFIRDSIVIDSLSKKMSEENIKIKQTEFKANFYYLKLNETNNKISYLETHAGNKDSLLNNFFKNIK